MELMSSAFLCVLVALLPRTLGNPGYALKKDTRMVDSTVLIRQNPLLRKTILLNINGPPLVSNLTELQSVFNDVSCRPCNDCMERAIRAHYLHQHISNSRPSAEDLRLDVLTNEISHRKKREVEAPVTSEKTTNSPVSTKRTKSKKNKLQKTITVTKYNVNNEVYALKVKETHVTTEEQNSTKDATTCQVYSVKKSFPCESPEGDALLSSAKRKANKKKSKKEHDKKITTSTTMKPPSTSVSKKREIDMSNVPENYMLSIEDIFNENENEMK